MTSRALDAPREAQVGRHRARSWVVAIAVLALVVTAAAGADAIARQTAYERTYAVSPRTVEHVGIADPPEATVDDHVGAILNDVFATDPTQLASLQHALRRAGIVETVDHFGVPDQPTRAVLEQILRALAAQGAVPSPSNFAEYLDAEQATYLASIAPLVTPHDERSETHQQITALEARSQLDDYLYSQIGRRVSDPEVSRFVICFNAQSASNPEVTVTTFTPAVDDDGLPIFVDGVQQYVDTATTTTGGVGVDGALSAFAESDSAIHQEVLAYRYIGYGNALGCAIQSPLTKC